MLLIAVPTDCSTLRRRQASLGCGQNRQQDRSRRGRQRHAVVVCHSSVCRCIGRYQHCLGATSSPDPTTTVYVTMVVTRPDDSAPAAASICLSVCLCIGVGGVNNRQPWRQSDRPLRPTDDWRLIPTPRTHPAVAATRAAIAYRPLLSLRRIIANLPASGSSRRSRDAVG